MAASYTTSLKLTLPADGDTGWGTTVNTGVTALVDAAVAATAAVTHDDTANYTLTSNNGAADEARKMFLNITGTLTAARNVVCPTASKLYFIKNSTTGGFSVTLKTTAGTGITVPNGTKMALYCDGTNVVDATTYFTTLASTGPILVGGPTTTSFTQGIQLYGNTNNGPQNSFQWAYGTTAYPATIYLIRSRSTTVTGNTAVANTDVLGGYGFGGTDGTSPSGYPNVVSTASITSIVDGVVSANTVPSALNFSTGTTVAVRRMNIASAGTVTMDIYGAGTATFSASGVISSVSDETLKIKDGVVADPIAMIMALEPGYYFGKPEANMGPGRQLGFYAQNVRAAIGPEAAPDPETVTAEDGTVTTKPWGYFDRSVLAVAVDAIKVQQAQIIALTARIAALEAK
jgi:hypothetical protein